MRTNKSSIAVKFSFTLGGVIIIFFLIFGFISYGNSRSQVLDLFEHESDVQTQLLALALAPQVYNLDTAAAETIVDRFLSNKDNLKVSVFDDKGAVFLEKSKPLGTTSLFTKKLPIELNGKTLGSIEVTVDRSQYDNVVTGNLVQISIINTLLLVLVVVTIIALLVFFVLSPLKTVGKGIKELSEGDGDLTRMVPTRSNDELGQFGTQINAFIGKIRLIIVSVHQAFESLSEVNDSMRINAHQTSASLTQISANTDSIKQQITQLDREIAQTLESISEFATKIREFEGTIGKQGLSFEETQTNFQTLVQSVNSIGDLTVSRVEKSKRLLEVTTQGAERLDNTAEVVSEIARTVGDILQIIGSIDEIASQTNILALNAAIEAAHAGEFGKGFSVVSDEIRKLAESSVQSSADVGALLKGIVKKIQEASRLATLTGEAFQAVQLEVSETEETFEAISHSVESLRVIGATAIASMGQLKTISTLVGQESADMGHGAEKVQESISLISEISSMVTSGIEEIALGTRDILSSAAGLSSLSERISSASDRLGKEVSRFKT